MACFVVPAAEALVVKAVEKSGTTESSNQTIPLARKLHWLANLLWGGVALLAFEHLWHGEIVPVFPFLTGNLGEVFHEMATVGVSMAVLITAVWAVMCFVADRLAARDAARNEA